MRWLEEMFDSIHPRYKEYASMVGLVIADTCIATVLFYTAHFIFAWPIVLIGMAALFSIITRTGIYTPFDRS